ncbi:PDZ domain-containing protein [Xylanibacillus composti]|uniref:endopeptidase La n=1 Tax=Xylanibacillus composti TaxID=1572762 RepID=A0A8J4M1K6_9BACL|nr:PDZ domain-containing protein [Xylanibacillus composti]MDT9724139.1 PDZ domain-containing protein [Xylanibacillus composti]GIQ68689.1 hypothetical protein XYCOK13_15130 [Xylanibacillus composti]
MTKKRLLMKWLRYGLLAVLVVSITVYAYWPSPYIIYRPGSAEEVRPMIHMEDAYLDEAGSFMLTTVNVLSNTNMATYWYVKWFNKHAQIFLEREIYREGETHEEYRERQGYNMMNSQSMAALAAYQSADIEFELRTEQVIVLGVQKGFPAEKALAAGDILLEVNGEKAADTQTVAELIQRQKVGDAVTITYKRNNEVHDVPITLVELDGDMSNSRPGIGVTMGNVMEVVPVDPGKKVTIEAGSIGGPSAGLMFAMEIYNQLVPEDVTKGYRIAGTGEINGNGEVGRIGGVRHKVIAADREKADLFFCPVENGDEARAAAAELGTTMEVVPVSTMDEVLAYLDRLPPKHEQDR